MNQFYLFESALVSATVQVEAFGLASSEGDSAHNLLIQGKYLGRFPVNFRQISGRKWCDIVDTGWPNLFLISTRLKAVLEEGKLSGWEIFDVQVYDKKGNEIVGYHGLSVLGRCGPLDLSKSEVFEKRLTSTGPLTRFYKGMSFDFVGWDRTDMFLPSHSNQILLTEKAAGVLRKTKISNLTLENLNNVEFHELTAQLILKNNANLHGV